jgi:tripartite ATP-independent transporter DctM subunit
MSVGVADAPAFVPQRVAADKHRLPPEDWLLAFALLLMIALPVAEIVLRRFRTGIAGMTPVVQHGTLLVSMVGAVVATRQKRLLSFGAGEFLKGKAHEYAALFAMSIAAATAALLTAASFRFVAVEYEGHSTLAWGIPLWCAEAILPIGFAWITLQVLLTSSDRWSRRVMCTLLAALEIAPFALGWIDPSPPVLIGAFLLLLAAAALGAPLFAVLGAAALLLHWRDAIPIAAMSVSHYSLAVNAALPAIPLFTLAGYILAEAGASRRLVRVFQAMLGGLRGGPALVTALACAFFTTFTGGSGVTILALGALLLPILLQARFSEKNALGLLTGGGAIGILFPPCLPLILYGVAANVEVRQLFIAGILPGLLVVALTAWLGFHQQPAVPQRRRIEKGEVIAAAWEAKWELLMPLLVLVSLFGGFATPVEAAAITALYALLVAVFHGDYPRVRDLAGVFVKSGLLVGGILLILGVSLGLTSYLIDAEIPQLAVQWVTASVHSKLLFLLLLNLFLVVVGAIMDIYSGIVVVVPLIAPLGAAYGIDPIHLGILFLTNLQLGYLMPPVGENLFISAYRFDKPIATIYRACVPMILIFSAATLLVTYVPWLTLVFVR